MTKLWRSTTAHVPFPHVHLLQRKQWIWKDLSWPWVPAGSRNVLLTSSHSWSWVSLGLTLICHVSWPRKQVCSRIGQNSSRDLSAWAGICLAAAGVDRASMETHFMLTKGRSGWNRRHLITLRAFNAWACEAAPGSHFPRLFVSRFLDVNKHSHVRSFLSVVTRPRAEPAVNDFPVVAWKSAEGKLRLFSLMCIYCRYLKLVASQYAIRRTILPCIQPGNGFEPVRNKPKPYSKVLPGYYPYCWQTICQTNVPLGMVKLHVLNRRCLRYQLVQDFVHQQYVLNVFPSQVMISSFLGASLSRVPSPSSPKIHC